MLLKFDRMHILKQNSKEFDDSESRITVLKCKIQSWTNTIHDKF